MTTGKANSSRFLSLRWKLLIAFSLIFSGAFAIAFYWFYQFATEKTLSRLRSDMEDTLEGAVEGVDVENLLELYETGKPNADGFSDDPRYQKQIAWFQLVHSIEPRAWLYSYLVRDTAKTADNPDGKELVYIVDLWSTADAAQRSKAAGFLETSPCPCPQSLRIATTGISEIDEEIYSDQFGNWLSAYAPLRDEDGDVVAILGLDLEAAYVAQVQKAIRDRVLVSFGLAYISLFGLVYFFSDLFTKNLNRLKIAAEQVGEGRYEQDFSSFEGAKLPDEISMLAAVFDKMVTKVKGREDQLKQQVAELKIEIDETKRKKQVSEIVDSDFFQDLQSKARQLRQRNKSEPA
ncbi:HAMP domain-containing protein [Leptolyngbya sp. AN02str]|uniref:HAMP domain-containing protein n=1 Tax=Leptolyngbya sp. AN02str TaxID=3423363 RepID=UPI003D314A57